MNRNAWTLALVSAGAVSLASVAYAEEQAMSQVLTAVSATTLSGYVDTSAILNFGGGTGPLPGRYNDGANKMDGFNLNLVGLTLEKPLGEDQWAAGYRIDLIYGPDAVNVNTSQNTLGSPDFALRQGYVNLRVPMGNGLEIKVGTFNTITGYEVIESYANPNFSRSYGFSLEPFQHTGVLATYDFTEAVSMSVGIANTWMTGINARNPRAESCEAYMASFSIVAPDSWGFLSGSSFTAGVVDGFAGDDSGTKYNDTVSAYVGFTMKTGVEGLSFGGALDYRFDGYNDVNPDSNWAWAAAGYLTFQATDKLKFAARLEYTTGSDGTYFDSALDEQNQLLGVTTTLDYDLWANVLTRLEFRWDASLTDDKPFNDEDENALQLAASVVYKF